MKNDCLLFIVILYIGCIGLSSCSSSVTPADEKKSMLSAVDTLSAATILSQCTLLPFEQEQNRLFQDSLHRILAAWAELKQNPNPIRQSEVNKQMIDWQNEWIRKIVTCSAEDRSSFILLKSRGEEYFERIGRASH